MTCSTLYSHALTTQFTCFPGTKVQILTHQMTCSTPYSNVLYSLPSRKACTSTSRRSCRCSVYLLYWYKSTNTDADAGAQFTCFTSTKVRILTQKLQGLEAVNGRLRALEHLRFRCTYFTCFTSTKVQILTHMGGLQHLSQSAHALCTYFTSYTRKKEY
jgi:hypothetical protein